MQVTWVVVADHDRATIYAVPRGMARLRELRELASAAELAPYLEEARLEGRFDELVLVAAPTILSHLRDSLSQTVRDALVGEISKNLAAAGRETLQEEVLRVL